MIIREYTDYIDAVHEKFPYFTKEEIDKILKFGLVKMTNAIRSGCFINFVSRKAEDFFMHIGQLSYNTLTNWQTRRFRMFKKMRKMYYWGKIPWDGYYYVGMTLPQYERFKQENFKKHNVYLNLVVAKKLFSEIEFAGMYHYVYRIKNLPDKGYYWLLKDMKLMKRDVELYATRITQYEFDILIKDETRKRK